MRFLNINPPFSKIEQKKRKIEHFHHFFQSSLKK